MKLIKTVRDLQLSAIGTNKHVLVLGKVSEKILKKLQSQKCHTSLILKNSDMVKNLTKYVESVTTCNDYNTDIKFLKNKKYNAILIENLEYISNIPQLLNTLRSCLDKNGYLVCSCFNISQAKSRIKLLDGNFDYEQLGLNKNTLHLFSLETLLEFLNLGGFIVNEISRVRDSIDNKRTELIHYRYPLELLDAINSDPESHTVYYIIKANPSSNIEVSIRKWVNKFPKNIVSEKLDSLINQNKNRILEQSSLIDYLKQALADKDTHIKGLDASIKEQEAYIKNLEQAIIDKDQSNQAKDTHIKGLDASIKEQHAYIKGLDASIKEQHAYIKNLEQAIIDKDQSNQAKDTHIKGLDASIKEQDSYIKTMILDKASHIAGLDASIKEQHAYIKNLEQAIIDKDQSNQAKDTHIKGLDASIKEKDAYLKTIIRDKDAYIITIIRDKNSYIKVLEQSIKEKDSYIKNAENSIKDKDIHLEKIKQSKTWKLLRRIDKLRGKD